MIGNTTADLTPPPNDPNPAPPEKGALLSPEILFLNEGSTYRLGSAFAGTADPTAVWQKMITNSFDAILYYRELEEKDEDVGDAVDEMKLSVTKRAWQVLPKDDSAKAIDAANFIKAQIDSLKCWDNAVNSILDAPFYGYSVQEMIFDVSSGQVSLLDIRDCPQELFRFAPVNYPQIGPLRMSNYIGDDGVPVPEQKFIVYSSRMRAGNRMGRPLMRNIYWPSWFKRNLLRLWMRLAEKGPGTAVVKYNEGAADKEKRDALASAEAIINSVAIAVPSNFEVVQELLTGARTQNPDVYAKLHDKLEEKIYRRIVGSTLTSHGSSEGKGTQALGNVHAETKDQRSVEFTRRLNRVLNDSLVRNLVLWNFGPDCPMPTLGYEVENEEDLVERMNIDKGAQEMGVPITSKYMHTKYGIPQPEEGDTILVPQVGASSPAALASQPQFSDGRDKQVKEEFAAFDTLMNQFRDESLADAKQRLQQVTAAALHSHGASA